MTIEYMIRAPFPDPGVALQQSLVRDVAMPAIGSLIHFESRYWRVTAIVHYPAQLQTDFAGHPTLIVESVPNPFAAASPEFQFAEAIEL